MATGKTGARVGPGSIGLIAVALLATAVRAAPAQDAALGSASPRFRVREANQRLEMIVNTSRILEMEFKVPRMLVNNPEVLQATPLSPNEVQISALKPGVTNLNLWDEQKRVHSLDVLVIGDARELDALLESQFPDASLKVTPLSTNVVISGFAPSADMVSRIIQMAEDYYPEVINNITVGGAQMVLLQVKVYEVSRTKLRRAGFDWSHFNGNDGIVQNAAGVVQTYSLAGGINPTTGPNIAVNVMDGAESFFGFMEALRQYNLVKVLAEPNLAAVSGRSARFTSGGEFPILIPQSLGTISVEFREFGTRLDFVPLVLGNGYLRLEVRPEVSEIDPARSVVIQNVTVPGLRTRSVDTAVEMRCGQTLAIAGLLQSRVEAQNKGIPLLADLPWIGSAFRRVEESQNDIELLIMVTPEFVDAVDPHEIPSCFPGQLTVSPTDVELFAKGYLEVPRCAENECRSVSASDAEPLAAPTPAGVPAESPGLAGSSRRTERGGARPDGGRMTIEDGRPRLIGPVGYQPLK
ncbi:MAG: type II and III secretion system protein family protein [Planctomycetes bacterium]|nr:type II and III secretion system protein family protein [Planctomycetota bacterium]